MTLRKLEEFRESRLWERLERYPDGDKTAIERLRSSVSQVAKKASDIGKLIWRYLPQYTLHEVTHNLNVLAIMDALTPDEVMGKLTPLECALCIMAAYTHDLGMALTEEEHHRILDEAGDTSERQSFLRYRDGFGEELRQVDRWREKGGAEAERRISLIEGHILASFIRDTHTNEDANRVGRWLDEITGNKGLFVYGNYDFKQDLALICISHGKTAGWLRRQLSSGGGDDSFCRLVGPGEYANAAFTGLLLRLADVMDFDASRAPRILFKHIGIENEKSILQWNKHISITGWDIRVRKRDPKVIYAAICEHPVYEKCIREFAGCIDQELRAVREELYSQIRCLDEDERRFELYLPAEVELRVGPKGGPHNPVYVYEDIEFRLDQDEIQHILMGESLWGNPQLCIRELLQNALDALHIRDLRLQLQKKGEEPAEPVDLLPEGEELRVILTWGRDDDSGQEYILVRDNGAGMTKEVITRYFTQIGKSFYRSPDFERERRGMKESGLLATPISIFGIGILSCFIIGDRLQVRTRPGGANDDDRRAYDITISGPGSLFWLKKGTLEHQGTEVKVFLKPEYRIEHDHEGLLDRLREHFGYGGSKRREEAEKNAVDPGFMAASQVIWPFYPVEVQTPGGEIMVRIDDRFHANVLNPIDEEAVVRKGSEWGCSEDCIGKPEWGVWDWTDPVTGSRIRLQFPRSYRPEDSHNLPVDPPAEMGLCRQDELAALVEPQLRTDRGTVITVKGMYVEDLEVCERELDVENGIGCEVWIDLRGGAAPQLTADRKKALEPEAVGQWRGKVHSIFGRMMEVIQGEIRHLPEGTLRNLLSGFQWAEPLSMEANAGETVCVFDLVDACIPTWHRGEAEIGSLWPLARLLQEALLHRDFVLARARASILIHSRTLDLDFTLDRVFTRDRVFGLGHDFVRDRAFDLAEAHARDCAFDLDFTRDRALDLAEALDLDLARVLTDDLVRIDPSFQECLLFSVFQEAFWPGLSHSFPMLNLFHLRGVVGDGMIVGPGLVEFDLESDGRTVHPMDLQGKRPEELARRGYDLVFPMTSVPLGELRRQCPDWRSDRRYSPMGTAPFLFPGLDESWAEHSEELLPLFKVERIFALLPRMELWSKRFAQWTEEDWETCGLSALWDIRSGRVLWAKGAHHVDEMQEVGKTAEEFLKEYG